MEWILILWITGFHKAGLVIEKFETNAACERVASEVVAMTEETRAIKYKCFRINPLRNQTRE